MSFKNSMGAWLTKALFIEFNKASPKFTLSQDDRDGVPSLFKLYMELADPTEYIFATTYLGGWDHWMELSEASFFKNHIQRWRKELEVKLKADAIQRILMDATSGSKSAFQANRYLLDSGLFSSTELEKRGRGRPSKNDIDRRVREVVDQEERVQKDFKRLLTTPFN